MVSPGASGSHTFTGLWPLWYLALRPLISAGLSSWTTASSDTLLYGPLLAGVVGTPGTRLFVTCGSNPVAGT